MGSENVKSQRVPAWPLPKMVPETVAKAQPTPQESARQLLIRLRFSQVWLWMSVAFFALMAGVVSLDFADLQEKKGREQFIVGLIGGAIAAVHARKKVNQLQSEYLAIQESLGDKALRAKQEKRRLILACLAGALILAAVGSGSYLGYQRHEGANFMKRIESAASRMEQAKQQLIQIRASEATTMEQYIQQCRDLEIALNSTTSIIAEYNEVVQLAMARFPNNPKFQRSMQKIREIQNIDANVLRLLRDEIAHSKKLALLPPSQRGSYFSLHIQPIREEQALLAEQQNSLRRSP